MQQKPMPELELSSDPDNVPPRSRLFIVVPKLCEPQQIQVSDAMIYKAAPEQNKDMRSHQCRSPSTVPYATVATASCADPGCCSRVAVRAG